MSQEDQTLPPGIAHLQELFSDLQYSTIIVPDEEGFDPTLGIVVELPYEDADDQLVIKVQYCETGSESFDDLFIEDDSDDEEVVSDSEDEVVSDSEDEVVSDSEDEDEDVSDEDDDSDEEEEEDSLVQSFTVDYQLSLPFVLPDELRLEAYEFCTELNKTTFLTPWRFDSKTNQFSLQYQLLLSGEVDENDLSIDIVEQFETIAVEVYPLMVEVVAGKLSLPVLLETLEADVEFEDFEIEDEEEQEEKN